MTIVAAYKQDNSVSIVSDFQVSIRRGENHVDSILKYFQVDDRMGFFMAGSVYVWKLISETIHSIADQISLENVKLLNGPLYLLLKTLMETIPYDPDEPIPTIAGIGVYWHPTQTVYFELRGELGSGILLSPMTDGITVLGIGSAIPGIHDLLARAVHRSIIYEPEYHPLVRAEVIRNSLKGILNRCGSSSFQRLGISHVFNIAWMNGTGFCMEVEEFMDHSSTYRTTSFDAPSYISDNNTIYILVERLSSSMIQRILYKTYAHQLVDSSVIADPRYDRLCEVILREPINHVLATFENAPRSGNYGLIVPYNKQASFEAGIATMVLDHAWMSQHVENYADIYSQ
ncbi:hypothetical protein [Brevibacillus sp. SIMBA_040]|uniref:hypothetical protein n=1 Tax=Brevibacillus sp. SIMBA_040 TaxID=3085781 RepID=UPI00397C71A8